MKTGPSNSIPTDAEFEAASNSMAARIRSEEAIKNRIVEACSSSKLFRDAYVWLPDGKCHVDLFVHDDAEVSSTQASEVRDIVIKLLTPTEEAGRQISVELDSHERILREFNGNYFNRFR